MIFVGDGAGDLPGFRFMYENAGLPLALRQGDENGAWEHHGESFGDRRVENVAPTDCTEGGEALQSILLAVDSIASRIALRGLSLRAGGTKLRVAFGCRQVRVALCPDSCKETPACCSTR